uniref:Uncharacterized protein n=1 Tax=Oryza glaberrima TaxID=4538 RepID=I1Q3Z2_ORYGL
MEETLTGGCLVELELYNLLVPEQQQQWIVAKILKETNPPSSSVAVTVDTAAAAPLLEPKPDTGNLSDLDSAVGTCACFAVMVIIILLVFYALLK